MKKIFILAVLAIFSQAAAQCVITGADEVAVGATAEYSANVDSACATCYSWHYPDQNIYLEGNLHSNRVTVKGALPGKAILTFKIAEGKKKRECQKEISVVKATVVSLAPEVVNCNLPTPEIAEKRITNTVVEFQASGEDSPAAHRWTVFYKSGQQSTKDGKTAQFNFGTANVIDKVEVELSIDKCTKKVAKIYNENFWYFF